MQNDQSIRLYWITGCSSCMRVKEFLQSRKIPFESINLAEQSDRRAELVEIGIRALPVVMRGGSYTLAQDIKDVASFLQAEQEQRPQLSPALLVQKLNDILSSAIESARVIPPTRLRETLPGRNRAHVDLAYHIFHLVDAFLVAADGGTLTSESYAVGADQGATPNSIAVYGSTVRTGVQTWWSAEADHEGDRTLSTFYGEKPLAEVLERTVWHCAHHARQLEYLVLADMGVSAPLPLNVETLKGLPLPENLY